MASNKVELYVPLNHKDTKALDAIFENVEVEEIHQIEAVAAFYSVAPLEPWEEQGWVVNSAFEMDAKPFVMHD